MGAIEARLAAMGHSLPQPRKFPNPNRCGCVRVSNVLFVSGHGPHHPGMQIREHGKLGQNMTVEEGYKAAQAAALAILATVKAEVGDLDRVKRVIRLFGMAGLPRGQAVEINGEFELLA